MLDGTDWNVKEENNFIWVVSITSIMNLSEESKFRLSSSELTIPLSSQSKLLNLACPILGDGEKMIEIFFEYAGTELGPHLRGSFGRSKPGRISIPATTAKESRNKGTKPKPNKKKKPQPLKSDGC